MRENPSLAHGIVESQNAELVRCSSRLISRHGHRRHSLRAVLVALETDDWRKEQGRGVTDGHLSTVKLCRIGFRWALDSRGVDRNGPLSVVVAVFRSCAPPADEHGGVGGIGTLGGCVPRR